MPAQHLAEHVAELTVVAAQFGGVTAEVDLASDQPPAAVPVEAHVAAAQNDAEDNVRLGAATVRDGHWTIRVEDSGRGVPAERVGELFTPFSRLGAEQTDVEGTGLGLAIVRRHVTLQGGRISLHPRPGGGAIARVTLPSAPAAT